MTKRSRCQWCYSIVIPNACDVPECSHSFLGGIVGMGNPISSELGSRASEERAASATIVYNINNVQRTEWHSYWIKLHHPVVNTRWVTGSGCELIANDVAPLLAVATMFKQRLPQ
jgi:hypothetical protein